MKSIELTQEQKDNLLEMCNKLFPEYTIYYLNSNSNIIEGNQWGYDEESKEDYPINNFSVHWFEFCMTHLQKKLQEKLKLPIDIWNNNLIGKVYFYTEYEINHPVDYLYEEFKKLK